MNLVTQTLLAQVGYHPIADFVQCWDPFEAAIIRIYKSGTAAEEDRRQLAAARDELIHIYPRWVSALRPFWQGSAIEGLPVSEDPFQRLLAFDDPASFAGNWAAMQTLPVAREAINRFLWEQIT